MKTEILYQNNCPINERTADGQPVGRCWMGLIGQEKTQCPRHGRIIAAVAKYRETGKLTDENDLPEREEVKP